MTQKIYLEGNVKSPAGLAPAKAWEARGEELKRPGDVWMEGDPTRLLTKPQSWFSDLKEVEPCSEQFGMRVRFGVLPERTDPKGVDFFGLSKAFLDGLSFEFHGLFLHGELTRTAESGIYISWDNRPPALLTQLWLRSKSESHGQIPKVEPPLHLNLLFHDIEQGYQESWNDGTMDWLLKHLQAKTDGSFQSLLVHSLSMARSTSREYGLSVGLEEIVRDEGSKLSSMNSIAS
jgi:hypothetical protein